ncbi:MAG TPA: hypothetical protein VI564_07605 [Candidatus Nanoarchaeia archaeon]|nr:hypothetical protein [Candidatus Nanoarchaeia archaeon]
MVNINYRNILIFLVVMVFLVNVAHAATNTKLIITDVDVNVGGKSSKNLNDGDLIRQDAEPEDSLDFKVNVMNNFSDNEDFDIDDITVTVTIDGIDDGDDLEEESTEFDLNQGNDKSVSVRFDLPLEVEEDSYDVHIVADGNGEDGNDYGADITLRLDVNKKTHQIKITRFTLRPEQVSCKRNNLQLDLAFANIGGDDENDVVVRITNDDLGIDFEDTIDELTADPFDDDSKFSENFNFDVADDLEEGTYPIELNVLYNNDNERETATASLQVSDCGSAAPTQNGNQDTSQNSQNNVDVTNQPSGNSRGTQPQTNANNNPPQYDYTVPDGTVVSEEGVVQNGALVVGIIIAEVVIVIVGIALLIILLRKKQ